MRPGLVLVIALGSIVFYGVADLFTNDRDLNLPAQEPAKTYRVVLTGDVSFGDNYQERIEGNGGESILRTRGYASAMSSFADLLRDANQVVVNLETPLTDGRKSPLHGIKQYVHWSSPTKTSAALLEHNVHNVSLANNHAADYGNEGLEHTLAVLKGNKIKAFGAGSNDAEAARPLLIDASLDDQRVYCVVAAGFEFRTAYAQEFGFYADAASAGVNAWTTENIGMQIRQAREMAPDALLVAYPHFGRNYRWKSIRQTELAHAMIDAGADLVIGHGAHRLQEVEYYHGRWIVYNLGNFVFNSPGRYKEENSHPYSLIAVLDISPRGRNGTIVLRLYPIISDNLATNYRPDFLTKEQFAEARTLLIAQSDLGMAHRRKVEVGQDDHGFYFCIAISSNDNR